MNTKILLLLCLIMSLQACSSLDRYQSNSKVSMVDDDLKYTAILYYDHLTGRTWYGEALDEKASDVRLRICKGGVTTKTFSENNVSKNLELRSKSRDIQTQKVDQNGALVDITPTPLRANKSCGEIWVDNKKTSVHNLVAGSSPKVYITCKSNKNATRYPAAGEYVFSPITKTEIESTSVELKCDPE